MRLGLSPKKTYEAVNSCIYCGAAGSTTRLTDEHIVPLSLGGTYVLPKASCDECARPIGKLEGYVARHVFQDVRIEFGLPTRRPKERPTQLPLRESFSPSPQLAPIRLVPTKDYPGMLLLTVHEPAGILMGRSPETGAKGYPFVRFVGGQERVEQLKAKGIASKLYREFQPDLFLRVATKMALGFAVAGYGLESFEPTVGDVILRRGSNPYYWIGGVTKEIDEFPPPISKRILHRIVGYRRDIAGMPYLVIQLQLFAFLGTPMYAAVVGKLTQAGLSKLKGAGGG